LYTCTRKPFSPYTLDHSGYCSEAEEDAEFQSVIKTEIKDRKLDWEPFSLEDLAYTEKHSNSCCDKNKLMYVPLQVVKITPDNSKLMNNLNSSQ
jgi:hypothetical protein